MSISKETISKQKGEVLSAKHAVKTWNNDTESLQRVKGKFNKFME